MEEKAPNSEHQPPVTLLDQYAKEKQKRFLLKRNISIGCVSLVTLSGLIEFYKFGTVLIFGFEFAVFTFCLLLVSALSFAGLLGFIGWFAADIAIGHGATRPSIYSLLAFALAPMIFTVPIFYMARKFEPEREVVPIVCVFTYFIIFVLTTGGYLLRFLLEKYRSTL